MLCLLANTTGSLQQRHRSCSLVQHEFLSLHIAMDIFKRLTYLHQAQDLLNCIVLRKENGIDAKDIGISADGKKGDNNKRHCKASRIIAQSSTLVKLNSFWGYLSKEIAMKHNIQM